MEVITFSTTVPAQVIMDPFTTLEMKTSLALSWAWLCRPTHQPWALKSSKSDWLGGEARSLGSHVSTWNRTQTKARLEQIKSMKPKHGIQIRWNWEYWKQHRKLQTTREVRNSTQPSKQGVQRATSLQSGPALFDPVGLSPRDSPGKNTGGGCHFLLQKWSLREVK